MTRNELNEAKEIILNPPRMNGVNSCDEETREHYCDSSIEIERRILADSLEEAFGDRVTE